VIVLLLVQEGDRVKFDAAWDEQRAKMKDGGVRGSGELIRMGISHIFNMGMYVYIYIQDIINIYIGYN